MYWKMLWERDGNDFYLTSPSLFAYLKCLSLFNRLYV